MGDFTESTVINMRTLMICADLLFINSAYMYRFLYIFFYEIAVLFIDVLFIDVLFIDVSEQLFCPAHSPQL